MKELANIKSESWIRSAVYGLLLIGIYYSTYQVMLKWWEKEDFSYCYLIAPVVLYLIWEKRERLAAVQSQLTWHGILPVALGVAFFWLGELGGEFYTLYISSWLILFGLCWIHLGWEKLKVIWFPIVFLIGMFPPPNFLNFPLTLRMKLVSSQIGVNIIQAYGLSAYREGNIIDLGFTQLQVVDACSGLRFLYPLIVMGILLAYFFRGSLWKRIVLVLTTLPLTVFTNSLRIALTGILYEIWGPKVAQGFFHGFSGWFIFMFALSILLLEMWMLSGFKSFISFSSAKQNGARPKLEGTGHKVQVVKIDKKDKPEGLRTENRHAKPQKENSDAYMLDGEPANIKGWKFFIQPPQFVVAVILLGLTLVLAQVIEFREKVPLAKPFSQFPTRIGEWSGKPELMTQDFLDLLDLSDYVIVNYTNGKNKLVNFYTAYYQSQRKGESIHSPATCLPGSGWSFKKSSDAQIPFPGHEDGFMQVNRAFMIKGAHKQLSYYWFPQRDRILTNAYQLKFYNFWDALTRQRTDGALVRVITPVYENEELSDAEKRLQSFTQAIVPVLDEFLPD